LLFLEPGLEHQHVPEPVLPLAMAIEMFAPALLDGRGIEESLAPQPIRRQQSFSPFA
jgi:hypothetical protein